MFGTYRGEVERRVGRLMEGEGGGGLGKYPMPFGCGIMFPFLYAIISIRKSGDTGEREGGMKVGVGSQTGFEREEVVLDPISYVKGGGLPCSSW